MASVSMVASFVGGASVAQQPSMNACHSLVVAKAVNVECVDVKVEVKKEKGSVDGRRAAMFAVAAAAVTAVSGVGLAFTEDDVPKRGTPVARKKFAPICVTMPTARVCNKSA